MYSRKIISFPLVAIAAVALIFGAGQVSAQLQNQSHLDEFEASCQTTWDGNSWESCESAHVAAETAFTATFCVSAPSCDYNCRQGDPHAPDSRSADLKSENAIYPLTSLGCPGGEPCPQCCRTYHWTTDPIATYYLLAYNTTTSRDCGPTKSRFEKGTFNCNYW